MAGQLGNEFSSSFILHSIWRTRIPRVLTFDLENAERWRFKPIKDVTRLRLFIIEKRRGDSRSLNSGQAAKLAGKRQGEGFYG